MPDWIKKIDAFLNDREEKRLRSELEKNRRESDRHAAREEAKQKRRTARFERRARRLGRVYKCHICRKPASLPGSLYLYDQEVSEGMEFATKRSEPVYGHNWLRPGDLYKCDLCHKWTCSDHIHSGICETCAMHL